MTDTQLLTIAIAIIVPLSLLLHSNSRITEAKETLRADIAVVRTELNARIDRLEGKIDRIGDTLRVMLEDHERRIRQIEGNR